MRTVYKVLAYVVAAEVVVQAMMIAWAVAGLGFWVDGGGVFDKSAMESEQTPFPEVAGIIVHGLNGGIVIPALALLLVVSSLFGKVPGSPWWFDSLNVSDGETYEIAFVADNPGIWADHCHNLRYAAGLLAHLMYEGYTPPFVLGADTANTPE